MQVGGAGAAWEALLGRAGLGAPAEEAEVRLVWMKGALEEEESGKEEAGKEEVGKEEERA